MKIKFKQYLIERDDISSIKQETYDLIKKDCQPYLKTLHSRSYDDMFYRYMKSKISGSYGLSKIITRTDRKPKDMPLDLHNQIDNLMKKKFGIKVRSEGVFTWTVESGFSDNEGHLIFPIGNYKVVYNTDISDLYNELGNIYFKLDDIPNKEDFFKKEYGITDKDQYPDIVISLRRGLNDAMIRWPSSVSLNIQKNTRQKLKPYYDKWIEDTLTEMVSGYKILSNGLSPSAHGQEYEMVILCKEYYTLKIPTLSDANTIYHELYK